MSVGDEAGRQLPEALLEEVFQRNIIEELIYPGLPLRQDNPELVLLVAQTGAGTGAAHAQLADEFRSRGGIVPVVTDELRAYHPDHQQLAALRPEALIEQTDQAARWWQDRAIEHLAVRGYNIVFEDRFGDPDRVLDTAETLAGVGYQVRVSAAATPAVLSRLGIIETFARAVEVTGTGPWVTVEEHDASYGDVTEILTRAEATDAVARITLHTPDGVLFDRQRDPAGAWRPDSESAVEVLTGARTEPLNRVQRSALANRLAGTVERLAQAGIAPRVVYEMAGEVAQDLAGHPLTLGGRTVAKLNTAMLGLLDADTGPANQPRDAALADLEAVNRQLDQLFIDPRPGEVEPPPPEPPGPDLGPEP